MKQKTILIAVASLALLAACSGKNSDTAPATPQVAPPTPKAKERPSMVPPIPPRPVTQE